MKTRMIIFLITGVLLVAGCKTPEPKPVTWEEQSAYLAQVKDPRRFGYSIYQTPDGIHYRGGCRVHLNQGADLRMKTKDPLRPVGILRGNFGLKSPLLFDFTSSSSWLEFGLAQKLGAQPVGERDAQLTKKSGEEIAGCLSVVPTLRLGQLYIENPLVYVRLARGPLGTVGRGIEQPELQGVIGWDLLKLFEQVILDYASERIIFSTAAGAYKPDPARLVATIPIVQQAGACAVRGIVDGKAQLIWIDPAGDFEVATDGAKAASLVQLDAQLRFSAPLVSPSPGGTRIGARLLKNYRITVSPPAGNLYVERQN